MTRKRRGFAIGGTLFFGVLVLVLALGSSVVLAGGSTNSSARNQSAGKGAVTPSGPALVKTGNVYVGHSARNDTSKPLRQMPALPMAPPKEAIEANPNPALGIKHNDKPDQSVQRNLPATTNMPSPILNFDGIPFPGVNCNCAPPDTNGEVGLTQYVQIVNTGFQVFNKNTGASVFGPVSISSVWQGFGGVCENNGHGDPVALYDQLANRWILTQFAGTSVPTDECVAVSQTSDAAGAYNRYDFFLGNFFFDYPKLGVWPDAYYMSMNVFNSSGTAFLGPQAFALDRTQMLAGNPATFIATAMGTPSDDGYMPADMDGSIPPPAGAPNPFLSVGLNATWPLHRFHVDFANPANSTFDVAGSLTPDPFTALCPGNRNCVPQVDTTDGVDGLADRGMFRSAYRRFSDGHEALVGNMTVSSNGVAGIRWFEVTNVTSGTPSFVQQSTYQPDSTWRWMGSTAMDASGDMALGFSASDPTIHPQIRYTGRLAGDPPNTMTQGEVHLIDGTGSQTDTVNRWGDYSDMTVDPVDDCTFWYTQEYYQTDSSFNWRTRIGNFKFPSCQAGPSGTLSGTVTDSSTSNPVAGATIDVEPLGATTVTDASGNYSITLPTGNYNVSASSFGYTTQTQPATINDGQTTTLNFALVAAPSGSLSGTVSDTANNPIANATVTINGTPIPSTTTDANGNYSFASVPNGTYNVSASGGNCTTSSTDSVTVSGNTTHNFTLASRHDNFGYFCRVETPNYIQGDTSLGLSGDDNSVAVNLPFPFTMYGQTYNTAYVCTNGHLTFQNPGTNCPFTNDSIPSTGAPNAAIYPFWDDMFLDSSSSTWTATLSNPTRFVIEWRNASFFPCCGDRVDFEVVLYDNGQILTQYQNVDNAHEQGNSATIGIENADGTDALQYSFNSPSIGTGSYAIRYLLPPSGFVQGNVTDANDHLAIGGATVKALQSGSVVRQTSTDANGAYRLQLPVGDYTIEASKGNYETQDASVSVTQDNTVTQDFALRTALGSVTPTSLDLIVPPDSSVTKTVTLSNSGGLPMTWDVKESGGGLAGPSHSNPTNIHLGPGNLASPAWVGNNPVGTGPKLPADLPLDPTWSTIANYPIPIMDNGADFIDGKEYSVGGFDGTTFANTAKGFVYDPDTNTWSPIADMPQSREKPAVVAVNGLLYVSGGWDTIGNPIAETDVYDPSTNTWTTLAPNPSPTAAPGVAVAGGDIYLVGGCADSFCTTTTNVVRYDPSANTWDTVAAYPRSDAWQSCGGINDKVYCSGGTDGLNTFTSGDVYDPGSNSWSPIANMPIDLWASAAGAANGQLIAAGGVTQGFNVVTNQTLGYDPGSDSWTTLPNAPTPRYRAGGSCGFYKVGGSSGGFTPTPDSELLSELNQCGTTDVPWLSENPTSGTVAPGGSQAVQVTIDTHGLAFGIYKANLIFRTNSGRHPNITVPIQLHVRYQQSFDSGGGPYTDSNGDVWSADRPYTPANNSGYVQSPSKTTSTTSAIGGTVDDKLYQSARITPMTYRFTALHQGTYHVELRFAEIQGKKPGKRQFDVIVNGQPYLIAFDIAALAGQNNALDKTLDVTVPTAGEVSVQLAARRSFGDPILNGIRVTSLP